MVNTIADVLNILDELGVFSYALPFILIFAVVFAILDKTGMLSSSNRKNSSIEAIIAAAIALLSLQFDFVSEFFAIIFPRFGIAIALFLGLVIFLEFFHPTESGKINKPVAWVGWLLGIGLVLWTLSEWDDWRSYTGFGGWFADNVWTLIVLGLIIAVIVITATSSKDENNGGKGK